MTDKKKTRRMASIEVTMADGTATVWTRADDKLEEAQLTETNVLIIMGPDSEVLMMYSPMMWLSAQSTYTEV